ncbi:MAG: hypothetical protein JKY56_05815 [Kofleriaceae bacterium]|nr:hypothetical protein [Kofleriaceae bacterium]
MKVVGSAFLLSVLSGVVLVACGADAPATPDARNDTPRVDARVVPTPDARTFPPFVDAMPLPDAGPECDDPSEPNNSENMATALAGIDDCDGSGGTVSGALDSTDEDWYTYAVEDTNCLLDPTILIATGNVEVCLFFVCTSGTEDFTCPKGSMATDVGTLSGCCSTSSFDIGVFGFDCDGAADDSTTNFMRVKSASQNSCETYSVGYQS